MYTFTWALVFIAGLSAVEVYSSHYHGPTAKPVVLHNGYLADTHEVAEARNAHLATVTEQSHGDVNDQSDETDDGYHQGGKHLRYHGPTAIPHVLHDGHIADTHKVAAAKAEHFAAVSKTKSYIHGGEHEGNYSKKYDGDNQWYLQHLLYHGPLAKPVVLKSGYLADTHEVAAPSNIISRPYTPDILKMLNSNSIY